MCPLRIEADIRTVISEWSIDEDMPDEDDEEAKSPLDHFGSERLRLHLFQQYADAVNLWNRDCKETHFDALLKKTSELPSFGHPVRDNQPRCT